MFSCPPYSNCIKKLSNFHLHQQKIFWFLVFSFSFWFQFMQWIEHLTVNINQIFIVTTSFWPTINELLYHFLMIEINQNLIVVAWYDWLIWPISAVILFRVEQSIASLTLLGDQAVPSWTNFHSIFLVYSSITF